MSDLDLPGRYKWREVALTPEEVHTTHGATMRGHLEAIECAVKAFREFLEQPYPETEGRFVLLDPGDPDYEKADFDTCMHTLQVGCYKVLLDGSPWAGLLEKEKPEGEIYGVPDAL